IEHQLPPLWGYAVVTPDYLRTMGFTVIKGRDFAPGEIVEPSVVIDDRTASWLWPGVDPLGKMLKLDSAQAPTPWFRVVAVVRRANLWLNVSEYDRNMAQARGLGQIFVLGINDTTRVALPHKGQRYSSFMELMVRTTGEPIKTGIAVRQALLDKGAGFVQFPRTWDQRIGLTNLRAKHAFMASLFTLFSSVSLALAALGVYAIIAHMVAQRTREFGVRIAVGAASKDIRQLVLHEGNVLALAGIAVGLLMTWYNAKWLRAFLFDDYDRFVSRVFAAASLALFAVAWLASYIPARRAMRIDPVEALRND
ncbi:MAG TPA: FtsX-like permease family protein, partial [Gemmatimonadaceae bacterium]